ncbi:phage tail protein [Dactylosporangium sp. NPDC006015]|uniref:phage tail protein n=1 Tax=Dactylosporangium sp. NPDC006015 TaxID=3154576 RepID=UPI0033B3227C
MSDWSDDYAVYFAVSIDDESLGAFDSCEGLGAEVVVEERAEGGNNGWVWQLPTGVRYSNVRLSRPVTPDSAKLARWFTGAPGGVRRATAVIEARSASGAVVARWALRDVLPVRWSGPRLDPERAAVITETVELAHHGFIGSWAG